MGWAIMHELHHATESNEELTEHATDNVHSEGFVLHIRLEHIIDAGSTDWGSLELNSLIRVGLDDPRQDNFLDLPNTDLLAESIPALTTGLLRFGFFLLAEDALALGLSLSVDLIEDGLLVTEGLRLQAGGEGL